MQDERRRYFRISDQMGVAYRLLAEQDTGEASEGIGEVESLLSEYDATIGRLLGELNSAEPKWAELVMCVNKKLDHVIEQLKNDVRLGGELTHQVYPVNISACGLGLRLDQRLAVGSRAALDLIMLPERRRFQALAVVVACDPQKDQRFYVRFDFVDLNSANQEELIQHIVRRQSDVLRRAREASEQD